MIDVQSAIRGKKVRATAGAVIEKDGKILLEKRNNEPFKGYWTLPGGHIDFGETAEQAVIREVKEETGLTLKDVRFLGYRDEIYPEINWHAEVLVFYGSAEGKENAQESEVEELRWFDVDEAEKLKLAFDHQESIALYRRRKLWQKKR